MSQLWLEGLREKLKRLRYRNEPMQMSPEEYAELGANMRRRLVELGLIKEEVQNAEPDKSRSASNGT